MHDMLQVRNDKTGIYFIFSRLSFFNIFSMSIKNIESSVILQTFFSMQKVTYLFYIGNLWQKKLLISKRN